MTTPDILDRTPPNDIEAERCLICGVLLNPLCIDTVNLAPGDFHDVRNATLWRHLTAMRNARHPIDDALLRSRLRQYGDTEQAGGLGHFAEVIRSGGLSAHAQHYAARILRESRKRQIVNAGERLLIAGQRPDVEPEDAIATGETVLTAISTGRYDTDPTDMHEATQQALAEIEAIATRGEHAGIVTGIEKYDREIGGLFPGELVILAARPSHGKTSLALQIAADIAARGRSVYFATLEMGAAELALKRLCSVSGISNQRVRSGKLSDGEHKQLVGAAQTVAVRNLHLHDWASIRPHDIQRAARRVKADVIFVDYLQIVTPPDRKKQRYEQVGEISKAFKELARDMRVPVVACAQIGREAEKDKRDTRPRLSQLRESGNLEADCDVALLLWRPEPDPSNRDSTGTVRRAIRDKDTGDEWDAELKVAKNRKGPQALFRLDWDRERTVFTSHGLPTYPEFGQ